MFYAVCPFCFAGIVLLIFSPIKWNAHHFLLQSICFSLYIVWKPLKSLLQNLGNRGLGSPPRVLRQRPEAVPVALGGDLAAFLPHDGSKLPKTVILSLVSPPRRSKWKPNDPSEKPQTGFSTKIMIFDKQNTTKSIKKYKVKKTRGFRRARSAPLTYGLNDNSDIFSKSSHANFSFSQF